MTIRFSIQDGTVEVAQYQKTLIYLHATFFITAAILAWPFWHTFSLRGLALAVLFIAIIFASILLHELAHLEVARRYRVPARRIDIHMLGGLVQFSESAAHALAGFRHHARRTDRQSGDRLDTARSRVVFRIG
jgi:Zn-dependent protease